MSPGADRHLVLVGLMGTGKTTVGAACATRLGRPFVDSDELVEATSGQTVADIFATSGEATFRDLERRAIADACDSPDPLAIACGGGAVLDADNRRRLRASGSVVWLRTSPAVLAARVRDAVRSRPLLEAKDPRQELERLAELRAEAYEAAAHVTVDTDGLDVDQVVDAVLREVAGCGV